MARCRPASRGERASQSARGKVFFSGRSQAIRIPLAFRMATSEVSIHRQGDALVIEPVEAEKDAMGWPLALWDIAGAEPGFDVGDRHQPHERTDVLARASRRR